MNLTEISAFATEAERLAIDYGLGFHTLIEDRKYLFVDLLSSDKIQVAIKTYNGQPGNKATGCTTYAWTFDKSILA